MITQVFRSFFPSAAALALLASAAITNTAFAANPPTCFRFEIPDVPTSSVSLQSHSEVWCYQKLSEPAGSVYIFNADQEKVRPELAMIIEPDGLMTHGSLLAGEVSVHSVRARDFNPFGIPTHEPRHLQPLLKQEVFTQGLEQSAIEVLNFLMTQPSSFRETRLQEGFVESRVQTELLPWRGYWWAYKGLPLSGTASSPLAKYDRFVRARTGTNPGAQRWENSNHRYHGIVWEGHCNGWAASSVLRREPAYSKRDPVSGVVFSVTDQKGILAETDYCATVAFYGKRYRGGRDDIRDIYPAEFHKVLTYYIGEIGKPVASDYKRDSSVDNHIVSGYEMDIQKTGTNTYSVSTKLIMHKYDNSRISEPGVAPEYARYYRYTLITDDYGAPIGGSWKSINPDFLWVPLASSDCNSNNPRIRHGYTADILDLPRAE